MLAEAIDLKYNDSNLRTSTCSIDVFENNYLSTLIKTSRVVGRPYLIASFTDLPSITGQIVNERSILEAVLRKVSLSVAHILATFRIETMEIPKPVTRV